jgi:ATP-dependent protease ClpP protease subunit
MLLKKMLLLAGYVLAIATPASAANFSMTSGCGEDHSDKSCTSIYLDGTIEVQDGGKWKLFLEEIKTPHAIVTLNSPGGSLYDGLTIAHDILNREYDTKVDQGRCASACGLIWLAGKTRYMSPTATIGFHQAKNAITKRKAKDGNDGMFDFYAKHNLSEKAMRYFFSAAPSELAVVTIDKAEEFELKPELWPRKSAAKSDQGNASTGPVAHASLQNPEIEAIKVKINDARMTQQMFGGAKYCGELNGASFYSRQGSRVVNLEEYFHSLESLVRAQQFNQAKRRPWTLEDAKEREEDAKKQAQEDARKCELVQSLPKLERQLQELQTAAK